MGLRRPSCRGRPAPPLCRGCRVQAARKRSCSTATLLPRATPFSGSAARSTRPTIRLLAWSHDDAGSEFYTLSVRNLETGHDLADVIADTGGSAVWSEDGRSLFYVRLDANHRPSRVFRHALGTSPEDDVLVYEESDPGFFVSVGKTQSRRFIVIHAHDHETSEARLIPADAPEAEPTLVAPRGDRRRVQRRRGARTVLHPDQRGRRQGFPHRRPRRSRRRDARNWTDVVPHEAGRLILSHERHCAASRAAGALRRAAAYRRPSARRRRGARHRLR